MTIIIKKNFIKQLTVNVTQNTLKIKYSVTIQLECDYDV